MNTNRNRWTILSAACIAATAASGTATARADGRGTDPGTLTAVKPAAKPEARELSAAEALEREYMAYKLAHQDDGPGAGVSVLRAPPPNDACSGAVALICGVPTTIDVAMATADPTDPVFPCRITTAGAGFNTVWYTFVATGTGATVTTCTSTIDTMLAVYSGACGALVQIDCNDDSDACGTGLQSAVNATGLTAGATYYVQAARFAASTAVGNITINLNCSPTLPANNECAGAIAVANGSTVTADTTLANQAASDPSLSCSGAGGARGDATLWYTFQAAAATALVDTCQGAGTNSVVAAFSGSCGSLTEIACNDDSAICGNARSAVRLSALTVGQTYYVVVADKTNTNTRRSSYMLRVQTPDPTPPAPTNDDCATAAPIAIGGANILGNTTGSMNEAPTPPACGGFSTFNLGVWYTFAGNGRQLVASTCNPGTLLNTRLYVYSGSCGSLTCVTANSVPSPACASNAGAAVTVPFCAQGGTTYFILVTNDTTGTGAFELSLTDSGACPVPPANDTFANAQLLTVPSSFSGNTTLATPDTGAATGTCPTTGGTTIGSGPAVWFRVNGNGRSITATTCGGNLTFDTKLNVLCGSGPGMFTCIAGNDDASTVGGADPSCALGALNRGSRATWCSQTNGVYYILLSGFSATSFGAYTLNVTTDGVPCTPTITTCPTDTGNPCPPDYDRSGEVNANDISAYLNAWYTDIITGTTAADFDGSGETNANDISAFLNAWYAAIVNGGFC